MKLPIEKIRMDGATQPRAEIDLDAVTDYAEQMAEGVKFPAVDVFHDGSVYWLAHGFHRTHAAKKAGHEEIECLIQRGTVEEARWFSYSMNQKNGMRRTSGDKSRAVKAALAHPKAAGMSDYEIARHVGCHQTWVLRIRRESTSNDKSLDSPTRTVTRTGKTYEMDTSNIGRSDRDTGDGSKPIRRAPRSLGNIEEEQQKYFLDGVRAIRHCQLNSHQLASSFREDELAISLIGQAYEFLGRIIQALPDGR